MAAASRPVQGGTARAGAPASGTPTTEEPVSAGKGAAGLSLGLFALSALLAALIGSGDEFKPRVPTLDALAGLAVGAFLVDRLLTFVPVVAVRDDPAERAADLRALRLGFGAVIAAAFVILTDMRAVEVLAPNSIKELDPSLDRALAVFAIAGGAAGLARLLSGINPQPDTKGDQKAEVAVTEAGTTVRPPSTRLFGLAGLVIALGIALLALNDKTGLELLGPETSPAEPATSGAPSTQPGSALLPTDSATALVVRFGAVFLAAAIVEQLTERLVGLTPAAKPDKAIVTGAIALVLGVIAARVFDLYLLHNIGFFGTAADEQLSKALSDSSSVERWGDTFLTGVVIAAGAKPVHDLASRLRKAKKPATTTTPAPAAPVVPPGPPGGP